MRHSTRGTSIFAVDMERFGDENDQYNEQNVSSPDGDELAEVDWIALLRHVRHPAAACTACERFLSESSWV